MELKLSILSVSALAVTAAASQDIAVYEVGDPAPASSVSLSGLTEAQEAIGSSNGQVFLFRAGQTLFYPTPANVADLRPAGVSPRGLVVGRFRWADDPQFSPRAFTLDIDSQAFTVLAPPLVGDPSGVRALAISDDGTRILGEATSFNDGQATWIRRPVMWTDAAGAAMDIGSNGVGFTVISDINNHGEAVGTGIINPGPNVNRGFARIGGAWIDIGGFGGGRTDANAINNRGVVTGNSRLTSSESFAFRWDSKTQAMERLRTSFFFTGGTGLDINDQGTVVGSARSGNTANAMYWPTGSDFGVNLNDFLPPDSGWSRLSRIDAIDSCGVVVGVGIRQDRPGYNSGYMAVLPEYDLDGDGLADCWELNGIDLDGDGVIDLDLPAMGADPRRKDLFVEIDAMSGRAPAPDVISRVVTAFANAPVTNLDGTTGIMLHAIVDETNLPLVDYPDSFTDFNNDKNEFFGTVLERIDEDAGVVLAAKRLAFRYCIFGNSYGGGSSSGLAELGGNDLMVTLGRWSTPGGTPDQQAGTFMHEFGHTIGLQHGGGDRVNYKPNYYSVMNYAWQSPHSAYSGSWRLDYSRVDLPDLDEGVLFEDTGLGGMPGDLPSVSIPFRATDGTLRLSVSTGPEPMDWDNSGMIEFLPTSADLNRIRSSDDPSPGEILSGHDDWANLVYNFRMSPSFADGVHETVEELTHEEHLEIENELGAGTPCLADFAEPYGVLDPDDVSAFVDAFLAREAAADLGGPDGLHDLADITAFISSYAGGCP